LDEIVINEKINTPVAKTPKVLKEVQESATSKRKRETPVSTRSTRSKFMEKTVTPQSTRSTRSTVLTNGLEDFFQDEENVFEENVFEENVIQDEVEQDTTWMTRIWNGVMTTVFFM
jgi:hypothetical protein